MVESLLRWEPLGLPIAASWLLALKAFGFFLHMVFMNLWLAGLPAALLLGKSRPVSAARLFKAMPFFMAFGINAGIVPLLFLQTLYPQFFYPATILQAWFWFLVIPLLIVAYYAVYLAAFDRYRSVAAALASIALAWIGLTFSSAMSLTAAPDEWPRIFSASAEAGAVHGLYLYMAGETWLRFSLMVGLAFATLAAYLALDAEFFSANQVYRDEARRLVAPLHCFGALVFAAAGFFYAPAVRASLPAWLWFSAGTGVPLGALFAVLYRWRPSPARAGMVILAQCLALLANALARQLVQSRALDKWASLDALPVRGDWDGFLLFVFVFAVVLFFLGWLARLAFRAARAGGS